MARMSRDDFAELCRCRARSNDAVASKRLAHEQIEKQVQGFLARGGQIKMIEPGLMSDMPGQKRMDLASKGGQAAAKSVKLASGLNLNSAAKFVGLSESYMDRICRAGTGPKFHLEGIKRRFMVADLQTWMDARIAVEKTA